MIPVEGYLKELPRHKCLNPRKNTKPEDMIDSFVSYSVFLWHAVYQGQGLWSVVVCLLSAMQLTPDTTFNN